MTIGEWRRGLRTLIQLELSRTSMELKKGLAGAGWLIEVGWGWLRLAGARWLDLAGVDSGWFFVYRAPGSQFCFRVARVATECFFLRKSRYLASSSST